MFHVISDGGCDLGPSEINIFNVDIVPLYISFDHENYLKEGVDISKDDYFKRLISEKSLFPKTAQPNPQDYIDICTAHLKSGKDLFILTISSKLSGTYNSASLAANILREQYPERTIIIVDSLSASIAQGLILREIVKMRDAGFTIQQTAEAAEKILKTTRLYFTLDTLEYLKKGGRVGPTTALVGGLLGLRPILHLEDGQVSQLDNVRGRKKAFQLIEEAMADALKDDVQSVSIAVGHILSEKDAVTIKSNIEASLEIKITNPVTEVGAAIGTHAGPGALAFAYCRRYESL